MEGEQDKARHAQNEEELRARSAAAPEVYEQPDRQINGADGVLIKDGGVAIGLADDHIGWNFDAVVQYLVLDFFPRAQPRQHRRDIQRPLNRQIGNRYQAIALMDSGLLAGAVAGDENCYNGRILISALALIEPGNAIIGQVKFVLLLKVDGSRNDGRNGDDHQQRANELLP